MRSHLRLWHRHVGSNIAAMAMTAAAVTLATLGLALFDAVHWRALPFPGAADVVVLSSRHVGPRGVRPQVNWSYPRAQFVSEQVTTVDHAGPWRPASVTLTGHGSPVVLSGEFVSHGYFDLVGTQPLIGRAFDRDELTTADPRAVAVVSAWFQRSRALRIDAVDVGSTLLLNGHVVTIVGVMPDTFQGLTGASEIWLPLPMAPVLTYPEFLTTNQDFITLIARRAPQVPHASIDREVANLAAHAYQAIPSDDVGPDVAVSGAARPLSEVRVGPDARRAAGLVLAGSLILYMLALANLTALHMSRAVARRRESAVTLALGASVAAVWRSLTKEGAVVVTAGAVIALGGLVAWFHTAGAIDPLRTFGRGAFGTFTAVTLDARVLGWWALVTLMTVAVAAAVPAAWAARRTTLVDLRAGARGSATTGLSWHRPGAPAIILGVEAALAVVLVVAAAQLLDSYRRMQRATIGVDAERVLTFEVQPPERTVPAEAAPEFIDRVLDAVRSVPGVESASVDGGAPLTGSASAQLHIVGRPDPIDGPPLVLRHYVGTEHFTTLGIPLRAGRAFTDADRAGAPGAVIISERAAHLYFPAGDALGQRVWFGSSTMTSPATAGEIVGIAGDVTYHPLLGEQTTASFYTPYKQFTYGWRVYFVKVAGDPMAMAPAIAEAVAHVVPDLPLLQVRSLHDVLAASSRAPKDAAHGTALLAVLGLLLAAGGIWAVVSHAMAQRTREVAIRMAHGATRGRIMGLVFTDGLTWPVAGLLLGTVISLAASGVLQSLLYAVTPGDPRLVVAGACVFVVVAAAACVAPAWRATRVNAVDVLRAD